MISQLQGLISEFIRTKNCLQRKKTDSEGGEFWFQCLIRIPENLEAAEKPEKEEPTMQETSEELMVFWFPRGIRFWILGASCLVKS